MSSLRMTKPTIVGIMRSMNKDSVAETVRSRVRRSRERFWRPTDFVGSPSAVDAELSRLARDGELARIRRGLYWRGILTPLGMAPPAPWKILSAIGGCEGSGPTGLSAASKLGLSTQVPNKEFIAVPCRPPRPLPGIHFVDRSARYSRRDARLNPTEVALLEVLTDWEKVIESPGLAAARCKDILLSGAVSASRLAKATKTEAPVTRARLRELLFAAGFSEEGSRVPLPRSTTPVSLGLLAA